MSQKKQKALIKKLRKRMLRSAKQTAFEQARQLRDEIRKLKKHVSKKK